MFFDKDDLQFKILDVVEFKAGTSSSVHNKRKFDAFSFRFSADAVITTDKTSRHIGDNFLCYFPADIRYKRESTHEDLIAVHLHLENYTSDDIEGFLTDDPERMKRLFRELLVTWRERRIGYQYECAALMNAILAQCYKENRPTSASYAVIAPSVQYLHRHFTDPELSIPALAAVSHISEVYFRKLFKKEFGISPVKYITHLRIRHAISLMSEGHCHFKEIAALSGYQDYTYFSSEFKRIKGVAPSQYYGKQNGM